MSAYDMAFSDAIYGACQRYVSRQRVSTMLSHEYGLLEERLAPQRGHVAAFLPLPIRFELEAFRKAEWSRVGRYSLSALVRLRLLKS